ncbi:MAG TPA: hypothetical protein VM123_14110 [archaeon]|nr:hypothetical protein [archaeon]
MRWIELSAFTLAVGLIFTACSDKNNDITAVNERLPGGGSLTMGSGGQNATVTESNAGQVSEIVLAPVISAFSKGYASLATGILLAATVQIEGNSYGFAEISGTISSNQPPADFNFSAKFYDFSEDGNIYLGGSLQFTGSLAFNIQTHEVYTTVKISGEISFAGLYNGSIKYDDLEIIADRNGLVSVRGNISVSSGETSFDFYVHPAGDDEPSEDSEQGWEQWIRSML